MKFSVYRTPFESKTKTATRVELHDNGWVYEKTVQDVDVAASNRHIHDLVIDAVNELLDKRLR